MNRPYLVLVNKMVMDRTLTMAGAIKSRNKLLAKGLTAVIAYSIEEA